MKLTDVRETLNFSPKRCQTKEKVIDCRMHGFCTNLGLERNRDGILPYESYKVEETPHESRTKIRFSNIGCTQTNIQWTLKNRFSVP